MHSCVHTRASETHAHTDLLPPSLIVMWLNEQIDQSRKEMRERKETDVGNVWGWGKNRHHVGGVRWESLSWSKGASTPMMKQLTKKIASVSHRV